MGRFTPGQSGNPAGRPKGASNRRTIIRNALEQTFQGGEQGFWLAIAAQASAGDATAAEMIAKRLYPALKPEAMPMPFNLAGDTPTEQARSVLAAVADGLLPVEAGKQLIDSLAVVIKIEEFDEMVQRVSAIEQALKEADK